MKNIYIVYCADWVTASEGVSSEEAATVALEKMAKLKGGDLSISPTLQVLNLSEIEQDFDLAQYTEFVYCPKAMANAGFHSTAKSFSNMIERKNNDEKKEN